MIEKFNSLENVKIINTLKPKKFGSLIRNISVSVALIIFSGCSTDKKNLENKKISYGCGDINTIFLGDGLVQQMGYCDKE